LNPTAQSAYRFYPPFPPWKRRLLVTPKWWAHCNFPAMTSAMIRKWNQKTAALLLLVVHVVEHGVAFAILEIQVSLLLLLLPELMQVWASVGQSMHEHKYCQEIDATHRRRRKLPFLIFPEGTTSNGTCLLKFRKGAFYSEKKVRPIFMKF
jgi:hypothetical protein